MISIFILLSILFIIILTCMVRYYLLQSLKSELFNGMVDLDYILSLLNIREVSINAILTEYHSKSKLNLKASKDTYYLLRECIFLTREYSLEQRRYLIKFIKRYYKILLKYSSLDELRKEKR